MSIENEIKQLLEEELKPIVLEIINESYMHNVPKGSESHFKVKIVSEKFEGLTMIEQHRLVNTILTNYIGNSKIHALSITSRTPTQWKKQQEKTEPSPSCRGGFGK
ncbi:hypothetical protein DICPUDRAFT_28210 [Dictyostelium purpureum]|uniref:BolA family protein n=1 Tax=Dictyostelium purpureum TaxID=5786 RepID=F0ZBH0_DICPU|nr:uncharacterized protein DICPUDRAFT_28210 [Dictyostelium purpureum]EGC38666.1 hypothetical protein DICPUDRAFT_28210 [Dictyostelium purpureum]|eukprot:XP_003284762.1 hypothetical protein DICPUDRAFT_28210 [Dictyostelium purpureum]